METYYNPDDLNKFSAIGEDAPELWKKFTAWYESVLKEGALTEREKTLIGLAVAHAVPCPYCIDSFTRSSLERGITAEEMAEAVFVAAAIKGGATLVHAVQMKNTAAKLGL